LIFLKQQLDYSGVFNDDPKEIDDLDLKQ